VRWATLAIRAGGDADAVDPAVEEVRGLPLRPALQGLIALVIYVVVFILAVGQALVAHLHQPSVGQVEVDPNFYIWAFRWWVFAVEHGVNPLYSHQIGAPGGYSLAWATTSPSVALLVSPITVLFGAVTSFNLVLLLAPPTAAWAAFVLARRITGRFWASLPAGAVFGFNVYMVQHEVSGQPNLTVTLLLPLMAYLVVLWWDGTLGRNGYIIWMTVAIALEFYTFLEAFAEMSLLWVVGILAGLLVVDRDTRRKVVRLAVHTVVAFAGALVLASPYLIYALRNQPTTFTRQQPQFSLDLSGLIVPRKDRELGITWWAPTAGHILSPTVYVGIPMLLVLVALAITSWRTSRLVRLLVIGFVATIVLAIGPYLMVGGKQLLTLPWSGLWSLPIFKSAEPIRFIDFTYLVLGLALSLWLATLTTSWLVRAARWALGIVALAAMFADLPTFATVVAVPAPRTWIPATSLKQTNAIPEFFTDGAYKKYIQPGATVVVVSHRGNAGMLFQAYTGFYFKIAGGFINASLSDVDALPVPVALLSYPNRERLRSFESYVRKAKISSIIVERAWSENWMFIFGKMGMKSATVGGVIIYSTAHMKKIPPPVTG
jgi:hypothetical protein